jgi:hypothetical protein
MADSPTAGTFTCAELLEVLVAMDTIWADAQTLQNNDFQSDVEALQAIRATQTARFEELTDPAKDKTVKVYWVTDCSESIEACSNDCSFDGPELEAKCEEYTLGQCRQAPFKVKEKAFRALAVNRDEAVAKGLLKRMKELDNYIAQYLISKLNTFAGVNQFEGIGDVENSGTTYVAASYWTADIFAYFNQVAKMNKFGAVTMIHGNNLWALNWSAQMNSLNQNQKDQIAKFNSLSNVWDPFNVDTVNVGEKVSYMVSNGSVAFVSKNYYSTSPTTYFVLN